MIELSASSVSELFRTVLQHMKCIQVRMEYAKVNTSQKQKYVLTKAINKVELAIDSICDLLPNSETSLQVKKELDQSEIVYVMVYTEQLMRANNEDLEKIAMLIDDYLEKKYNSTEKK